MYIHTLRNNMCIFIWLIRCVRWCSNKQNESCALILFSIIVSSCGCSTVCVYVCAWAGRKPFPSHVKSVHLCFATLSGICLQMGDLLVHLPRSSFIFLLCVQLNTRTQIMCVCANVGDMGACMVMCVPVCMFMSQVCVCSVHFPWHRA